ncbi:MAG: amino acid ABC transporter permease [Clostridiales bacterium]|jgi:His/Glu/Gln/Arg/opine family amino acid ABC transporter permease subunit|nr:amino acid ABC transporter permease [Clostridiales bacterium]
MINNILNLVSNYGVKFLQGAGYTLMFSAITVFFGVIFGSLICMVKRSRFIVLRFIAGVYIEVIRGTPILLQMFFFYFFLPLMTKNTLNLSKTVSIVIALIVNSAAYVSEIVRSGIQAVDYGQTEAARSLGLNRRQTMMRVILPQAVRNILPTLGNEFIMVIKETALGSTFYIGELMTVRAELQAALFLAIEPLVIVAAIYLVLTFSLSKGVAFIERRMAQGD